MRSKRVLAALVSGVLVAAVGMSAVPSQAAASDPVVVAVIDTGINPHHPEFDYGGPGDPDDQIVGWWDFSDDAEGHYPGPGDLWDPVFPEPYDVHGHGTATASMAVGRNRSDEKSPAAFPGGKLAMAKVGSGPKGSVISGDLSAAFEWATETVGADVISMSIGSGFVLLSDRWLYEAISAARDAGVLVVVSNGNGFLNAAIPGEPGMLKGYGNSPDVLAVGAAGASGALVTTDPEVVADFSPIAAHKSGGYAKATGTSFSAPFVAGFGARLIDEARSAGRELDVARLEDLLKFSSRDTALPPNVEGHGVLDLHQLPPAIGHARAGTLPAPDPVNQAYSTLVRDTVTELLRG
ncbi:MAG: S8 family serine peptidase [Actinobacteria bacterium]|nr:S8 family serine peptidase [Actinomycetota bacterium]